MFKATKTAAQLCILSLAAITLYMVQTIAVLASEIGSYLNEEGNAVITVSGEFQGGEGEAVAQAIQRKNQQGKLVTAIRFDSPGGLITEGVKLAKVVRGAKLATVVARGSTCASACFIPFVASHERWKSTNARVGVHGASLNGQENTEAQAATVDMSRLLKALGTSDSIIGKLVTTPPEEVFWLSDEDLEQMGVRITGRTNYQAYVQRREEDPFSDVDKFFDELFQ